MKTTLKKINRINGVRGSLLVNREGMIVVSDVTEGVDEGGISALSSTIFVNLQSALKRLDFGMPSRFTISGERGRILLFNIGDELVLTVLTRKDVNMGLLKVEIKESADELLQKLKK